MSEAFERGIRLWSVPQPPLGDKLLFRKESAIFKIYVMCINKMLSQLISQPNVKHSQKL